MHTHSQGEELQPAVCLGSHRLSTRARTVRLACVGYSRLRRTSQAGRCNQAARKPGYSGYGGGRWAKILLIGNSDEIFKIISSCVSLTEPSSLFALQSQFTATPTRTLQPKPNISFLPVVSSHRKVEAYQLQMNKVVSLL
ncbi:hypothetical protein RvY_18390-2 [Ramazzottius varieornatus]|uniref:Uncharacterized protein n=1 Tax=Ramazzottius varieornatus TaxID=947166 RepID=A0A1D1WB69_RAMVA|nr:hypothetical protein RvY_18390-2 [Ramazzottius varieornatus]